MAQSSLSQSLQVYEAELGTPIFMRTARGVRPTASGEAFIGRARQILQSYHLAKNEVWDIEGLRGGRVEFGISTFRGTYLLPPVLKRFHELHPNVHVEITEMDSIDLEDQILKGLLDIALIAAPPVRIKSRVDPLMRDEILIVAADSHPVMALAKERTDEPGQLWVDFRDTADFEYILGPPDTVLGLGQTGIPQSRPRARRLKYAHIRAFCRLHGARRAGALRHVPLLHRSRSVCRLSAHRD